MSRQGEASGEGCLPPSLALTAACCSASPGRGEQMHRNAGALSRAPEGVGSRGVPQDAPACMTQARNIHPSAPTQVPQAMGGQCSGQGALAGGAEVSPVRGGASLQGALPVRLLPGSPHTHTLCLSFHLCKMGLLIAGSACGTCMGPRDTWDTLMPACPPLPGMYTLHAPPSFHVHMP